MGKMVPAELDRSPPLSPEHVILVPGASKTASIPKSLPPFLASVLPIFSAAKGRVSKSTSEAKGVDWVVSEKNMRQKPASPLCLVVCGAALRCCELVPLMRKTNKLRGDSSGGHVSKLFAKHQKVWSAMLRNSNYILPASISSCLLHSTYVSKLIIARFILR